MRRSRRGTPDRFLIWKVGIFFLAAGLWLGGVWAGLPWLTGAAIALLLVALVLRLLSRDASGAERAAADDEEGG